MAADFGLVSIEMMTALLAMVVLAFGLLVPKQQKYGLGYLVSFGLAGILAYTFTSYGINQSTFEKMFILDDFAVYFKQLFLVAAILVSLASVQYVKKMENNYGEFYVLLTFATLGMMIMSSAGDLITLYIALELMTITFYILTGYKKGDHKSAEAGIKYLILGAMSSGILLYGLSLVYGFTGTTVISEIAAKIAGKGAEPAVILGMVLLITGFGFKISSVPFQMWSPDVYEGAPTPVTAFLAVGSKAAAFAVIMRVFLIAFPGMAGQWKVLFSVLAAITIVIGNLVAIPQTNIKRMLAYSSIAQAGYLMTGIVAANELGAKGIAFYGMLYVFATIGAFTVVMNFGEQTGSDEIKDYAGLAQRSPLMAAVLTVCLLSMAGIPPLAGFAGKFYLFSAVVAKGYLWLALLGLVMSMASVYYYLSVAKTMYMNDPAEDAQPITVNGSAKFTLIVCLLVTVYLGIHPTELAELANKAAAALFNLM